LGLTPVLSMKGILDVWEDMRKRSDVRICGCANVQMNFNWLYGGRVLPIRL
jgi:hypothetical protein